MAARKRRLVKVTGTVYHTVKTKKRKSSKRKKK